MDTYDPATGEVRMPAYPDAVAKAICQVMGADLYVQKRGKNQFHGYKFATIGDLLDKLQPLMAEAGLVVLQHELSTDFVDGGNVMATRYQFTLAHTSGAVWPEKPVHTGMVNCRNSKGGFDDKSANKCHTAARKYFLLGLFQVPTGEDFRQPSHDGDADEGGEAPAPNGRKTAAPAEPAEDETQRMREEFAGLKRAIKAAPHVFALDSLMDVSRDQMEALKAHSPEAHRILMDLYDKRRTAMEGVT